MSDFIDPAFLELQTVIGTAWPFVTGGQYRDTQIKRIKWLEFLMAAEATSGFNFECPFVVEEFGPWASVNGADGWGYAGDTIASQCNVFLIDKADFDPTDVTVLGGPGIVGVVATTGMFAGQNVHFSPSGVFATIVTVDSAVQITVDDYTGVTVADTVAPYDVTELLAHHAKTLRDALSPIVAHSQFFLTEFPTIDLSSSNPANAMLAKVNYKMQAVQLSFMVCIGQ